MDVVGKVGEQLPDFGTRQAVPSNENHLFRPTAVIVQRLVIPVILSLFTDSPRTPSSYDTSSLTTDIAELGCCSLHLPR